MNRWRSVTPVIAFIAALVPSVASGQSRPFSVEFNPNVTVEQQYNDNFFLRPRNQVHDWRTTTSPGAVLKLTTGPSESTLTYALSVAESSALDWEPRIFHKLDGDSKLGLGDRIAVALKENFTKIDDPAVTDPFGIQLGRRTLTQNSFSLIPTYTADTFSVSPFYSIVKSTLELEAVSRAATAATAGQTAARNTETTVQDAGASTHLSLGQLSAADIRYGYRVTDASLGRSFTGHDGSVGLARELGPAMRGTLAASASLRDPELGRPFNILRGSVGLTRDLRKTLVAEASIGYEHTSAGGGHGAPSALLRLEYTGAALTLSVVGTQTITESAPTGQNVGLVQTKSVSLQASYAPTDRLVLKSIASAARTSFLGGGGTTSTSTAVQDNTRLSLDTSVTFSLSRVFSLSVGHRFSERDVDKRSGLDYTNNIFSAALTAKF